MTNDGWTGSVSTNWSDAGNWALSAPPTSANTAYFNGTGNGNTSISLGGTTQTTGAIQFDTGTAAGYTIGGGSADTLAIASDNISANVGSISITGSVTNPQTINANVSFTTTSPLISNATTTAAAVLTLGSGSTNISLANGSTLNLYNSNTNAVTVVNSSIQGSAGVALPVSLNSVNNAGTFVFNGQSTYTGTFDQLSNNGVTIQIGSSTNTNSNSTFTSGPFGTGIIKFDNTSNSPLQAVGADQVIANTLNLNFGFNVTNAASGSHALTFTGPLTMISQGRTITNNNAVIPAGDTATLILGLPGAAASTLTLYATGTQGATIAGTGTTIINDVIQNNPSLGGPNNLTLSGAGTVYLMGANTYSGTTTLGGTTATNVRIGIDSAGPAGAPTSGPFGTGTLIANNSTAPAILEPLGADRTIGNPVTLTTGFWAANLTAAQDPTGPHNLTLSGNVTLGTTGRTITNNMVGGVALIFGQPGPTPPNLSLGSQLTFQTQTAGGGITIINDVVQNNGANAGSLLVQNGAVVQLTAANTYTGGTKATSGKILANNGTNGSATGTGAVSVTGSGTVGSGGTLGGTGTITGTVTLSSTTAASQGGTLSPGNSVGTLNVGSMVWNPNGQYLFEHSATSNATGGTTNDFINGTGTLDLSALLASGAMTINLKPTNFSPTPTQMDYTIATFQGGIFGANGNSATQFNNGDNVSSFFTLAGTYTAAPAQYATIVGAAGGPQSLVISATPVPEPTAVLAACGAAFGGLTWWRRKRGAAK